MITGESPGTGSRCLALEIVSCYLSLLWGALPLLIYVEGAGYMTSPSRIRTNLFSITSRIQVRVLLPCKGNIPHAFRLKPAHQSISRPAGPWALLSV